MTAAMVWCVERAETLGHSVVTWYLVESCGGAWDALDKLHGQRVADPFGVFRLVLGPVRS